MRFVAGNDPRLMADFRDPQLDAIETLVTSDASPHDRWNGLIDSAIRPAAVKIQIMDLRHMAEF